jgi:pimeloyl-ACP methyl ester carboxylesterase
MKKLLKRIEGDIGEGRKSRNLEILSNLDGPPFEKQEDYSVFTSLMSEYGMNIDVSLLELAFIGVGSGVYNVQDMIHWVEGAKRGLKPFEDDPNVLDLPNYITEIGVPCLFIFGENDYNTPAVVAEEFLENVDAPQKEIVVFEDTSHTPFFKDKEKFSREVVEFKNLLFL